LLFDIPHLTISEYHSLKEALIISNRLHDAIHITSVLIAQLEANQLWEFKPDPRGAGRGAPSDDTGEEGEEEGEGEGGDEETSVTLEEMKENTLRLLRTELAQLEGRVGDGEESKGKGEGEENFDDRDSIEEK
jgi:hypothetical protein